MHCKNIAHLIERGWHVGVDTMVDGRKFRSCEEVVLVDLIHCTESRESTESRERG